MHSGYADRFKEEEVGGKETAGCVASGRGMEFSTRINDKEIRDAQELLALLGLALGLAPEILARIPQAEVGYVGAREELLKALARWDSAHTVQSCLACVSPRVDWVQPMALYRCQECGAEENRITHERKATLHAPPLRSTSTGPTARNPLMFLSENIDESTTYDRKEQAHG